MPLNLRLVPLPLPHIADSLLAGAEKTLREITARNLANAIGGVETRQSRDDKEG